MSVRARIIGCGSYLPERILTNAELATMVDTSDEWIVTRTGIRQRHIVADGEKTSDLGFKAAAKALQHADMKSRDIDLVLVATATPDNTFPATATKIQAMLGMRSGAAFDLQAVCSGFVYGLAIADNFIKAGQVRNVLLIGAEVFSCILDWKDRSTCVLFGDGAGAVVVRADGGHREGAPNNAPGILSTHLHSDGTLCDILYVDGGPSSTKTVGHVRMVGREVFRHAVINLAAIVDEALEANGLTRDDIDWLVPHQANKRILVSTARRLGLPYERVVVTIDRHANTSAASIPLALAEAVGDGRIKEGDLILMEAMGGGFTWGSALLRW